MKKPAKSAPARRPAATPGWLVPALAAALTVGLRLWFVLSMRGQPFSTPSPQVVDSWYYYRWALDIIAGDFWGHDVFFLRPLYPYLLALLGAKVLAVQLLQVLLAGISCLLLWDLARRVFNRAAAALAAFGFALTGILVFYTGALLYVELTVFLCLLLVWLVLVAGQRLWLWLACGLAFGLLTICRPELLILLPALFIWLWRTGSRVRFPVAMSLVALVVVTTVPVRNYIVARDPVLFTAHSGINFYYGNNPDADGTWQPTGELEQSVGFSHEKLKQTSRTIDGQVLPWSRASAYWLRKGLDFVFSKPLAFLRLLGRKFLLHWADYEVPNNYYPEPVRASSLPLRLAFLTFGPIAALGLVGIVLAWRERRKAAPLYFVASAFLLSSLAFYVLSRLRASVIPFLLAFAGFAVVEVVRLFREKHTLRAVLVVAVAAVLTAGSLLVPIDKRQYSTQAWAQLGNIWLEQRQAGLAVDALRRAIAIDPANISARYSLIQVLAGAKHVGEAETELRTLAGYAAGSELLQMAQARVAIARRDFPIAVALYSSVIAAHPDNAEAHYLLGLVYVTTGDLEPAREALTRALELDPTNDACRDALARVTSALSR